MLDFSGTQGKMALVAIVVVVLGLGYFLWTKSASPTPRLGPGQSLQNPFGAAAPGPGGRAVDPSAMIGPSPNAPIPGRRR